MDFLLELLFGIFFEVPMELTMESKTLKPWVKTLAFFLVGNLLTVLLLVIYGIMAKDPSRASDAQAALYFAIAWFVIMTVLCALGHRSRWGANKTCNFVRPLETPGENVPNADVVIRTATMDDLNQIARVEAECFPAASPSIHNVPLPSPRAIPPRAILSSTKTAPRWTALRFQPKAIPAITVSITILHGPLPRNRNPGTRHMPP